MFGEWARRTSSELQEVYNISWKRAGRIVNFARTFHHPPEKYSDVLGTSEKVTGERKWMIAAGLINTLIERHDENPEEAWNNLMDEWGCSERADAGVYLRPWDEIEEDGYDPDPPEMDLRVSQTRPD